MSANTKEINRSLESWCSIARVINSAKLSFQQAHKYAHCTNTEAVERSREVYKDGRYWRQIRATAQRQAANMDAAGLTEDKPYFKQGARIVGACTAYDSGVGVIR